MGGFYPKKMVFPFLFFFFLFSIHGVAQDLSKAEVLHSKGTVSFSKGEFEEALKLFKEAYKIDPNNKKNTHLLGLTYLKLERYNLAAQPLKELLEKNPDYSPAYLDYGVALYRLGDLQNALPWLEKTQQSFPNTEKANVAGELIATIKGEKPRAKRKRWRLTGSAGFFYDSNLIQDPDQENLTGFTNQEEFAGFGTADFKYHLIQGERTNFFGDVSSYQSAYLQLLHSDLNSNNFNYGRHRGSFEMTHRFTDYVQWRLPFGYTFTTLGRAKYLHYAKGESNLDLLWEDHWLTTVTFGFRWDDFFGTFTNAQQDRDALHPYATIEQYFFSPNNRDFYIKAGFSFEKNLASGNDWDYNAYHVLAALQIPLGWNMKFLLLEDVVTRRTFDNVDSVFSTQRTDQTSTSSAILSKELSPHSSIATNYTFYIADSNIRRFSSRRHLAGLTFQLKL